MFDFSHVNLLAGLLILTSLALVLSKSVKRCAVIYVVQSLVLISLFLVLGTMLGSPELYTWSATAFVMKVVAVPSIVFYALRRLGNPAEDLPNKISPVAIIVLAVIELSLCFFVVSKVELPAAQGVTPALAISLAHFFMGLNCIIFSRNIFKQLFGYCLMENGSHLTLALLAAKAPELVEVGVATDALFAVIIMAVLATMIYRKLGTLDAKELMNLKG